MNIALLLSLGIGFVTGLRSMTAPAVVAWAAHLGWIRLQDSPLAFMETKWAVGLFTIFAVAELIADQLPKTPARTAPVGLIARIVVGGLCGACMGVAGGASLWLGSVVGVIGALMGTFAGYQARTGLVRALHVPDFAIAVPEDIVAIGLGLFIVSRL